MNRPLSAPEIVQHQHIATLPPGIQDSVRTELLTSTRSPEKLNSSLQELVEALSEFNRIVQNLNLAKAVAKRGKATTIQEQITSAQSFLELGDILHSSKNRSAALSNIRDHTRTEAVVSRVLETPTIADIKHRYGITEEMGNHPDALRTVRAKLCGKFGDFYYSKLHGCTVQHAKDSFPSTHVEKPGDRGDMIFNAYFTRTLDSAKTLDELYAAIIMAELAVKNLTQKQAA